MACSPDRKPQIRVFSPVYKHHCFYLARSTEKAEVCSNPVEEARAWGCSTYKGAAVGQRSLTHVLFPSVIVVLFVTLKRQKKEPLIVFEEEDVRENIITYDDEGGGEEDTEAFDIATLQNPDGINGFMPRKDIKPEYQYLPRPGLRPAPNSVDVDDFINTRIQEADNDPTAPPYDSIQIYGYEGRGSVAGSLSSLESATTDSDLDYDYLQNWGPRFKKLADLYGSKDTFDDDS